MRVFEIKIVRGANISWSRAIFVTIRQSTTGCERSGQLEQIGTARLGRRTVLRLPAAPTWPTITWSPLCCCRDASYKGSQHPLKGGDCGLSPSMPVGLRRVASLETSQNDFLLKYNSLFAVVIRNFVKSFLRTVIRSLMR